MADRKQGVGWSSGSSAAVHKANCVERTRGIKCQNGDISILLLCVCFWQVTVCQVVSAVLYSFQNFS